MALCGASRRKKNGAPGGIALKPCGEGCQKSTSSGGSARCRKCENQPKSVLAMKPLCSRIGAILHRLLDNSALGQELLDKGPEFNQGLSDVRPGTRVVDLVCSEVAQSAVAIQMLLAVSRQLEHAVLLGIVDDAAQLDVVPVSARDCGVDPGVSVRQDEKHLN